VRAGSRAYIYELGVDVMDEVTEAEELTAIEARLLYAALPPSCTAPTDAERPHWVEAVRKLKAKAQEASP
jgi:hypothetical protein